MYIIFIQPLSNHSKICCFFFGGAKWKNRKERSEIYRVFVSVCQALEMNCVCRNGKHTTNKSETKPKKKEILYLRGSGFTFQPGDEHPPWIFVAVGG